MSETRELTNFHYISLTNKGPKRTNNEDYLGYFDTINGHVFVVCDGIGGLPCGEKASQTVVNSVKFFFSNFYYNDPYQAIIDSLNYAQDRMAEEARNDRNCQGMGTTMVLALIRYNKVYYAHLGDSRLYYLHDRKLQQLTIDDSYVEQLVQKGEITHKDAENHPRKNELVKAMGMQPPCKPNICISPIIPNDKDLVMLCTDGLYNMISEKDIQSTLCRRGHIEDKGLDLMKTAIKNGGDDNISLQIIKFFNVDSKLNNNTKTTNKPKFENSNRRRNYISFAGLVILIVLFLGVILLRNNNEERFDIEKNKTDFKNNFISSIEIFNQEDIDSIVQLYNLDTNKLSIVDNNGRTFVAFNVKKIVKTRFYDNVITLEKQFNIDRKRLMTINKLNTYNINPGTEIVIPNN
ncbi:MAG: protein phosphatase 2C domain-containing protein [Bacteroidales bacterium]|nr:protein phosphatase 2C domain-containing protein [Bacteroidales bacterium]